ncbi:MAG: hypothetical protein WCO56_05155 [Verrucomicrobiota bacterium]
MKTRFCPFRLVLGLLVAAAFSTAAADAKTGMPRTADSVILAMLTNIKTNGLNAQAKGTDGLGGLWINWRTGTQPLVVNLNGSGEPDGDAPEQTRHDDLTDLRYLHNLFYFKHQHPHDPQFDGEIRRFSAIVKKEFADAKNERGWIYDELISLWQLSGDDFFRTTARGQVEHFVSKLYRDDIGAVYKLKPPQKTNGYYRVDHALQIGCAMVQAGTEFKQPEWTAKGERLVQFVYDHAYLKEHHVFLAQMDEVRLPDGSANPNQKIYREKVKHYVADGGHVRLGGMGQDVLSLLHAYIVTKKPIWLDRATDLLTPLTADVNELGLWDTKDGGYFAGVEFNGPDFRNPGQPKLSNKSKESGRQFHLLQAFHVANQLTGGKYQSMVNAMTRVLLEKAYYAPGGGILYEVQPDWTPRVLKNGKPADWVTTEAMGCAMMALFSMNEPQPW